MSIDFSTIRTALNTWAETVTSLSPAIWADQNAPQPYDDEALKTFDAYIILRLTQTEQIAEDYEAPPPDSGGISTIYGNREFMVFIEIKGKNALIEMNKLLDSFQRSTVRATLYESKIIYVDNFPIQNITGLDDTQYIERTSMDVLFRTESVITDTVGIIEDVEVTGTIKNEEGDTIYNETVLIESP